MEEEGSLYGKVRMTNPTFFSINLRIRDAHCYGFNIESNNVNLRRKNVFYSPPISLRGRDTFDIGYVKTQIKKIVNSGDNPHAIEQKHKKQLNTSLDSPVLEVRDRHGPGERSERRESQRRRSRRAGSAPLRA